MIEKRPASILIFTYRNKKIINARISDEYKTLNNVFSSPYSVNFFFRKTGWRRYKEKYNKKATLRSEMDIESCIDKWEITVFKWTITAGGFYARHNYLAMNINGNWFPSIKSSIKSSKMTDDACLSYDK